MKFGICNEIFQDWELGRICDFIAGLGYDGVELAPFTLGNSVNNITATQRSTIRGAAQSAGVEICGLHWLLAKTEGLHLTNESQRVRDHTADYLRALVDCCSELGGKTLVLGSPQQRSFPADTTLDEAWKRAAETLGPAVSRAQECDVVICIEPLSPQETNFINTAEEAIRFAAQFSSPAVKIVLDVKAMCSEQKAIPQIIRESAGHFAHFHANDANLKGPGFGKVDFRPIFQTLRAQNYSAYVSVEVFRYEEGLEMIAQRSLQYMRDCLEP